MFTASELARICSFVRESNAIEGIYREPTEQELAATQKFLALPYLTLSALCELQEVYAPGKPLRNRPGLNVRVGNHVAPYGGSEVEDRILGILHRVNGGYGAWEIHVQYEDLHPFCDGNGRTGRAIWGWQMYHCHDRLCDSFLHQFYYQTLQKCGPTR